MNTHPAQATMGSVPAAEFPALLRTWRHRRRLSQLDLALSAGVSQRHVSFLESGRARPSRGMILQLGETLDVPLRERNAWLMAAGFAPLFLTRGLDDPQMNQVMAAVRMMLSNHEPFPAAAIDRAWNVRLANGPFEQMLALLGTNERNLMRLFFHPEGIRAHVTNWSAIAPLLWCRAQREAETADGHDMKAVLAELEPGQDDLTLWGADDAALLPVLPLELLINGLRVSLFSVISTFGTAQDVTADELRVETFFPADAATEALFRGQSRSTA